MARPAKRLTNMEIDEISLVDKGANQHAMITIAKRAPEEEAVDPELYNEEGELLDIASLTDGDVVYDDEGNAYEFSLESEEEEEIEEPELAEVGKAFKVSGSGVATKTGDALEGARHVARGGKWHEFKQGAKGYSTYDASRANRAGKALWSTKGRKAATIAGGTGATGAVGYGANEGRKRVSKSFTETVMEELSKAYSDEDRDQVIAKALGRVEELETLQQEMAEIAKSERDLRLTREYISKAAEYNVPVDPEDLGPVLYRMAENMSYEDCAVIHKALESAGSMIFEEQGYIGGGDNTDVMSMVEAQAVEIGKSATPENIVNVLDQSPEAYEAYLADRRGRY